MGWTSLVFRLAWRSLAHPSLARDLLVVAWRFRPVGWWRRPPFLPLPDRTYIAWRMYTAYGDPHAIPPVDDIVRYARWAARMP